MTTEEIIALSLKVKDGEKAKADLEKVAKAADDVGNKADKASQRAERGMGRWQRAQGGMKKFRGAMVGVGSALAVVGGAIAKKAVSTTDGMIRSTLGLSRVTGMNNRTAAEWIQMAKLRGVKLKDLQMGFVTLSKNIDASGKKGSAQRKAFQSLGVDMDKLKKMTPNQAITEIADRLKKVENPVKRNALGAKLLGRSYVKLGGLLSGGRKGIEENRKAVKDVADAMGGLSKKEMTDYLNGQRKLKTQQEAWQITLGTRILPIVNKLIGYLTKVVSWITKNESVTKYLIPILIGLGAALAIINVALSITATVSMLLATPWLLWAIAIAAVVIIFVVLYKRVGWFRKAVDAVIKFIKKHWKTLITIMLGPIGIIVRLIIKHWSKIVSFVKSMPGKIKKAAKGLWDGLKDGVKGAINWILRAWNKLDFGINIKVPDWVPGVGGKGFKIDDLFPDVPLLGSGGNIRGAGSFVAGEVPGRPELVSSDGNGSLRVTPLGRGDAPSTIAAGGGGQTIVIDAPLVLEHVNGEVLGRLVGRAGADRSARLQGA